MAKKNYYAQSSSYDEAIRTLRTNLLFSDIDNKISKVVVTSSVPDEGKTSISFELAKSLAQNGNSVVLLESDLRNPSISEPSGLENSIGITNILMKKVTIEEALVNDIEEDNLFLLFAGPTPPNPAELISSDAMKNLILELDKKFDYVIIDTPPVGILTDAAIMSTYADGVVLVVKNKSTKIDVIKSSISNIKKVNSKILGAVLTHVKKKDSHYGGYYGAYYGDENQ